jgi:hypothetical protein
VNNSNDIFDALRDVCSDTTLLEDERILVPLDALVAAGGIPAAGAELRLRDLSLRRSFSNARSHLAAIEDMLFAHIEKSPLEARLFGVRPSASCPYCWRTFTDGLDLCDPQKNADPSSLDVLRNFFGELTQLTLCASLHLCLRPDTDFSVVRAAAFDWVRESAALRRPFSRH